MLSLQLSNEIRRRRVHAKAYGPQLCKMFSLSAPIPPYSVQSFYTFFWNIAPIIFWSALSPNINVSVSRLAIQLTITSIGFPVTSSQTDKDGLRSQQVWMVTWLMFHSGLHITEIYIRLGMVCLHQLDWKQIYYLYHLLTLYQSKTWQTSTNVSFEKCGTA